MSPLSALLQRDEAARESALHVSHSILLQAPAGSGKTTVLVCRVLALLVAGEEPESILAITFSRKAAAEMRERVMRALQRPDDLRHPEALRLLAHAALARDRERHWELLRNPGRLRIQTFDSLNQRLAAQAPVQAGGGAGLGVTETPDALYARAARRLLERAWQDRELAGAARILFEHLDNSWELFETLLAELLAQRLQWLPRLLSHGAAELADQVEQTLATLVHGAIQDCLRQCPALGDAPTAAVLATTADNLWAGGNDQDAITLAWRAHSGPLCAGPGDLLRWRLACRLLLTGKGEWRRSLTKRDGVPTEDPVFKQRAVAWLNDMQTHDGLHAALVALDTLPDLPIPPVTREALQALAQLMRHAVAELHAEFAASGIADFSFLAGAARQSLTTGGEPTDLALRFGTALRHVLVDEFQDTSSEQAELLAALTADWSEGDGRTLFLVGDPMQSIYQFRAAEVGVFLQARSHGIGPLRLHALELRRNYRSGPGVVEWVNRCVGPLFPARDDLRRAAISFLESVSAREQTVAQVCVCAALQSGDAERDRSDEAQQVLEIVRRERAAEPGCSIAVLVAGRAHAVPIAALLAAQGIPVRGVKLAPLAERSCVRDLLMLARALQHRGDRTAWLALLRSPLCGLELQELQALAGDHWASLCSLLATPPTEAALSPATCQRLQRLRAALAPALDGAERQEPLAQRVARTWLRLGGADLYHREAQRADVRATLAALADGPEIESHTGEEFAALLADLYADSTGPRDAVQILTMHGAKGLEWDVVIVPGLHRSQQHDRRRLLEWLALPRDDRGTDLLFGPIDAAGDRDGRSLSRYIRDLRRQRGELERRRLLYVTATRAKRALYWLGRAVLDAKTGAPRAPAGSLLRILWPAVEQDYLAAAANSPAPAPATAPASVAARPRNAVPPLERLPLDWRVPDSAASPPVERLPIWLREPGNEPEYSWVGATGRAVGTVIHAELQRHAARQRAAAGAADEVPEDWCSHAQYMAWLAELGVPQAHRAAGAERVLQTLSRTLRDERGRWLLAHATHREACSERRLTGLYEGEVVNIVIDRMFVDTAGTRWIVDFKTGGHEGGDLQAFVDQEVERYRPQLQRYASLARRLGPEPVRCALYFPLLGQFREL